MLQLHVPHGQGQGSWLGTLPTAALEVQLRVVPALPWLLTEPPWSQICNSSMGEGDAMVGMDPSRQDGKADHQDSASDAASDVVHFKYCEN